MSSMLRLYDAHEMLDCFGAEGTRIRAESNGKPEYIDGGSVCSDDLHPGSGPSIQIQQEVITQTDFCAFLRRWDKTRDMWTSQGPTGASRVERGERSMSWHFRQVDQVRLHLISLVHYCQLTSPDAT